jgi:hypothetical protein
LCYPFTLLVVLASSISDDQNPGEIVNQFRPETHLDWGRARKAGSRFDYNNKELGP